MTTLGRTKFPRVPLPRQRSGAYRVHREVDARDDINERLNDSEEVISNIALDIEDDTDFYDYLISKADHGAGDY